MVCEILRFDCRGEFWVYPFLGLDRDDREFVESEAASLPDGNLRDRVWRQTVHGGLPAVGLDFGVFVDVDEEFAKLELTANLDIYSPA